MEALVRNLNTLCDEQPFDTGWYLKDLRTGQSAHRNGHVVVYSASTRKIAILMAALKAVHEGKLSLDQPVAVEAKYASIAGGCFARLRPGLVVPFRDFLTMMIILSDNTSTPTVVDMLGLDRINAFCQSIGMVGTTHRQNVPPRDLEWDHLAEANNATTPADVGLLLDLILQGTADPAAAARLGTTSELCQLAIDTLSWQMLREKLPHFLPMETKVAHKTGHGPRTRNDAGIIFLGDQPLFILSVYTDRIPVEGEATRASYDIADHHIGRMCRVVYDTLRVAVVV